MTRVEIDIIINRPAAEVFDYIAHFPNNVHWQNGVKEATITSAPPFGVGSTYTQISQFLGRKIVFHFEITAYEAHHLVEFKTVSGSFPVKIRRAVEPIDAHSSRVIAIIEGEAGGFFRLFAPMLDWMTKRSIQGDYARLKHLLESQPPIKN